MKYNDHSDKKCSREALELLRTVPEGPERCRVSKEARRIASTTGYIFIRGCDMAEAIRLTK